MIATLTLSINQTWYDVTPIRGIQDLEVVRAWRLARRNVDGAVYDVSERIDGLECTCPDFEVRRRGLDASGCKHIKSMVAVGLIDGRVQ